MELMVGSLMEILTCGLIPSEMKPKASANMFVQVLVFVLKNVVLVEMCLCRLHFDYQVAVVSIDVLWVEDAATCRKRATGFVPTILVKVVEIIAPSELKLV